MRYVSVSVCGISIRICSHTDRGTDWLSDCLALEQEERYGWERGSRPAVYFSPIANVYLLLAIFRLCLVCWLPLLFKLKFMPCIYYKGAHTHTYTHLHTHASHNRHADKYASQGVPFEFRSYFACFWFALASFFTCLSPLPTHLPPVSCPVPTFPAASACSSLAASRVNGCVRANFFRRELR